MAVARKRKRLIIAVWRDQGAATWDPQIHGKGLAPLQIKVPDPGPRSQAPAPLELSETLEFRLESRMVRGKPFPSIVCEGVVVAGMMPPR
jgi:hypothetical protein